MSRPIDILTREHRVIEKVLDSLHAFTQRLEPGGEGDRRMVAEFAEFFREFADRCHHGKEEDRLFVSLVEHGVPRDAGPVAVMLQEHEIGRGHVEALTAVGAGSGPLSAQECETVRHHAEAYVPLLALHIQKEDQILFPLAERILSNDVLEDLGDAFDAFEEQVMRPDTHSKLHALAEKLISTSAISAAGKGQPAR